MKSESKDSIDFKGTPAFFAELVIHLLEQLKDVVSDPTLSLHIEPNIEQKPHTNIVTVTFQTMSNTGKESQRGAGGWINYDEKETRGTPLYYDYGSITAKTGPDNLTWLDVVGNQTEQTSPWSSLWQWPYTKFSAEGYLAEQSNVGRSGLSDNKVIVMSTQSPAVQPLKQEQLIEYYRKLDKHFNQNELRDLAFQLGIDYDGLPGDGKADKARELVQYLERRGRSPELAAICLQQRPNVDWPLHKVIPESAKETESSKKSDGGKHVEPKPGWRNWGDHPVIVSVIVMAALIAIIVFFTGAPNLRSLLSSTPTSSAIPRNRQLIEKMSFDYSDSPEDHGWIILDQPQPTFNHISSGFVGEALEIKSYEGRAMDFPIGAASSFGTMIEYAVKLEGKAVVYTYVKVQSKDGSTSRKVWFAFVPGTKKPEQVYAPPEEEWTVYVRPEQLGGGWILFRIDLKETVMDTVGTEGWSLEQLQKFRLRGNLSVAQISIYE
jgi:hypothetical protein